MSAYLFIYSKASPFIPQNI